MAKLTTLFLRFSFSGAAASAAAAAAKSAEGGEEESEEPPKVEVNTVQEEDSVHSVRCKLFFKKEKEFMEKGLGMLHLKVNSKHTGEFCCRTLKCSYIVTNLYYDTFYIRQQCHYIRLSV